MYDLERGYENVAVTVRERLLRRCSRFDISGDVVTAGQAVSKLGERVQQKKKAVLRQMRMDYYRSSYFGDMPTFMERMSTAAEDFPLIKNLVAQLLAKPPPEGLEEDLTLRSLDCQLPTLVQPVEPRNCYGSTGSVHALVHEIARRTSAPMSRQLKDSSLCSRVCKPGSACKALLVAANRLPALLDEAQRNENFYHAQVKCMTSKNFTETDECTICMDNFCSAESVTLLPCAHYFHTGCAHEALRRTGSCPMCRRKTSSQELSSMGKELAPDEIEPTPADAPMSSAHRKHGSKLNALANRLRLIKAADPAAQVIVYTQWLDLEQHVQCALHDHGVTCARLTNKPSSGNVLHRFQEKEGPWVLLLSLSTASSGLNITAASHVVFVHPMNAQNLELATSFEQQAIGRIRRIGQEASIVHVWRFVTRGTVEEHVVKLHGQRQTACEGLEESI